MRLTNCLNLSINQRYSWGPLNFGRMCCSMGPQQFMFYCIFKREFSESWGLCCSMGPDFPRKNLPKTRHIFGNFFKESMFYASKWSQMKTLPRILIKSPINLHTGRFWKILKNFEDLTPKE